MNNKKESLNKLIYNDKQINKSINELLNFLYKEIEKINNEIVIRNNKINFFDMLYYLTEYNSIIKCSHQQTLLNYIINSNKNIEKNTIISRLEKLDPLHIKNLNKNLINNFYEYFKINKKNLICSVDGSNIKLLASLNKYFKLNKNNLYTNAYLSCVFDVDNQIPIYYDIFKSSNEITNLKSQIKNDENNITYIADRGYDDKQLLNFYLENKMYFVSRIVKNNSFTKELLKNDNNLNEIIIKYTYNNKIYNLKIVKYSNIEKPDIKESLHDLKNKLNETSIEINNIDNKLKTYENEKRILNKQTKEQNILLKNNKKLLNKTIQKIRIQKFINKNAMNNIIKIKNETQNKYNIIKHKIELLKNYEHSDYFILTNNDKLSLEELKNIYKKRWVIETEFKYHKTILNLNQMNNKNINIINSNIYIIQFISILSSFITKILEKYKKTTHNFNNNIILTSIHDNIMTLFYKILINKKNITVEINKKKENKKLNFKEKIKKNKEKKINAENIKIILRIFCFIIKNQIIKQTTIKKKERIKKRQSNNKFNYRKKNTI